ncbi:hypothetical protein H9Q72_014562, partial [Fusarium xylarioides]
SELEDNVPELDRAPTEVKSSAGAATPHDSEVELPSDNDTAPETPCPAEKQNSSAAVTPVKTPRPPRPRVLRSVSLSSLKAKSMRSRACSASRVPYQARVRYPVAL